MVPLIWVIQGRGRELTERKLVFESREDAKELTSKPDLRQMERLLGDMKERFWRFLAKCLLGQRSRTDT